MKPTRRLATATAAALLVLGGCADASGGPDTTGIANEAAEASTGDPHGEHEAAREHDQADTAGDQDRTWTTDEIAAAFNAHAGAHARHGAATQTRTFPSGIQPDRISIPAIGVDANVIDLSLAGSEPEVPENFGEVGWYAQTRKPGEIGPAVLAGHVDSRSGPAVFIDLHKLDPGDEIVVSSDGEERRFTVDDIEQYPKDALPGDVFGFGQPEPQLRLITCGGDFDRDSGHYRDNVVVYASLADA